MALSLTHAARPACPRAAPAGGPRMRVAAVRRGPCAAFAPPQATSAGVVADLRSRVKATKAELKSLKRQLKQEEKAARAAAKAESDSSSSSSSSSSASSDDDDDMKAAGAADEATTAVLKVSVSELVADASRKAAHRRKAKKGGAKQHGGMVLLAGEELDSNAAPRAATSPSDLAAAAAALPPHPRVASAPTAPPPPGGMVMDASSPLVTHTPTGPALSVSGASAAAASAAPGAAATTVLKVCTGAACRRLGAATLLARLRAEHDGPVRACSCLGRCGRSRAEAASDGEVEAVASWWEEQNDEAEEDFEPFAAGPGGAVVPTGFV